MTRPAAPPLLLPGLPPPGPDQRRRPHLDRVPAEVWAALTAHAPTRRRYLAKVHRRGPDDCWYWTGAISDTGHGKLRAGSRAALAAEAGEPPSRVVTAHVFGWHLIYGPTDTTRPRTSAPVIAHRCDEASCNNPAHWRLGDTQGNTAEYMARRTAGSGPLADRRGPDGRARAIAAAIRAAQAAGTDPGAAIAAAIAAGLPRSGPPASLF